MNIGMQPNGIDAAAAGRRRTRKFTAAWLAAVFVVSAFLWGYSIGAAKTGTGGTTPSSASSTVEILNAGENKSASKLDFEEFWQVWQTIKDRYVKQPVDERAMFYGAMEGVVASLGDPHSIFFDPPKADQFTQELSGKFSGIGAEIGVKKGKLVVIAPLDGSPAEKAGLLAGDAIVAIDGVDTTGMAVDEAVSRIRGDKGTKVELYILRGNEDKPRKVDIVRDTINIQSVRFSSVTTPNGKKIALIKVTNFNEDTADKFQQAVGRIGANYQGVIIDLRGNPGGFLDDAISMLGEWAPGDIVVSERYSDGSKEDHRATGQGRLKDMKTIVLVDGGSASASEIMSGALQDLKKAKLIGTQTFGKGSVQDLIPLKDGAALKLTIAEWLTPNGNNINDNGITPDYKVDLTEDDYQNDRDPQMDAARGWFDGVTPKVSDDSATSTKTQ